MIDDREARLRAAVAAFAERAATKILKELAKERQRDFEEMFPRGSGTPARQPKAKRPLCGAKTRTGAPCKARVVWPKGDAKPRKRRRNHGGLSTGPRTLEGKKRSAAALGLVYSESTGRSYKPSEGDK